MNSQNLESIDKAIEEKVAENTKVSDMAHEQLSHQIKLANGIAISALVLLFIGLGWYFENHLSSIEQQSLNVSIASSSSESLEDESQLMIELISNEKTNQVASVLATELLNKMMSLEEALSSSLVAELSDIEEKSVFVLAVKQLVKQKQYLAALTILSKMSLSERLTLGLQFSKALTESRLKLADATLSYQQLLEVQPQHQSAIINLSLLYLDNRQSENAEVLLRDRVESMAGVKKAKGFAALGRALDQQNRFQESQVFYL